MRTLRQIGKPRNRSNLLVVVSAASLRAAPLACTLRVHDMTVRKKLLFSILALVLAFGFLEGVARIAVWMYHPFGKINAIVMADLAIHHTYIPSSTASGLPYTLHINRQSWPEDHDIQRQKPPGVYRIFMVGDSNTQGFVNPSNRWVTIVGSELNKRAGRDGSQRSPYEVINAGRVSYSPLLYYLHIKNQILSYSPDLVVINVDMSDCRDDAAYRVTMRTNNVGEVIGVAPTRGVLDAQGLIMTPKGIRRQTAWERRSEWVVEHSAILAYLELGVSVVADHLPWLRKVQDTVSSTEATGTTNALPTAFYGNWVETTWTRDIEDNVAFSMSMLGRSIDLLKSNRVGCIVVGVPHYAQFAGKASTRPFQVLARTASEHGVLFLNLYEALSPRIANTQQPEFYGRDDPFHFNVRGNQLWADAFLEFWEKNKTNWMAGALN